MKAFVDLVFPNSVASVLSEGLVGEPMEHGIITSVTHGVMPGIPSHLPFHSCHAYSTQLYFYAVIVGRWYRSNTITI